MPKGNGISDKLSSCVSEMADLKSLLDLNIKKCFYELNRINRYIESIEDSQMRMILSLRYVNRLSWQQIAFSIGGNTSESVRKAHDRFLDKK